MKKIRMMIIAVLAMLMPTMLFGGGKSSTYYSALKTQMSSKSTGMGKVYAGASQTAPATSNYQETSSQSSNQSSSTKDAAKTFYAFATANEGYEFVGWATSENGTTTSSDNPYAVSVKCSSTSSGSPTLTTVYANFKKKVVAAFSIIFETSSAGTYTVDGAAPANKIGLTEATSVVLKSTDANFLNWLVNGTVVNNNPYTATCLTDTTISAEFLTADQVTSVTTLADLTAALSNAAYKKIIIPSGTEIVQTSGTLTIPSGKQLVVEGTIFVFGTLSNSGTISGTGTIAKTTKTVTQGAVVTPANTYTNYPAYKYQNTTISSRTVSVSGATPGCNVKWAVELSGDKCYVINSEPDILVCSIDQSVAKNHITKINSSSSAFTHQGGYQFNGNTMILLTKDTTMSLNDSIKDSKGYLGFQGIVDCAGYRLTLGSEAKSNFYLCAFNGKVTTTTCVNIKITEVNCTDLKVQSWNAKSGNNSARFIFYDHNGTCTWAKSASGETTDMIFFYSGTFTTSLTYEDMMCVHGGTFKSDPKNYLFDSDNYKTDPENNYFVVKPKVVVSTDPIATVNGTPFVNFFDAVAAAKGTAYPIVLIEKVVFDGDLTIGAGTNITIRLDEHSLECSKIVNHGNLQIEDARAENKGTIKAAIDNYGVLDITFGTYSGMIANYVGGVFTAHNGLFEGGVTHSGGTINYKGGRFPTDTAVSLMDGYGSTVSDGRLCVFEWPNSDMVDTTLSGYAGWSVTPYSNTDYALLKGYDQNSLTRRTDYSTSGEWQRVAELLAFYDIYQNETLDASVAFDRDVRAGSVTFYGKTSSLPGDITPEYKMDAGVTNRVLSAAIINKNRKRR